jgi:hypothetical protein
MGPDENLQPKNEQEQDQSFALVFLSHENRITNHGATIIAKAHGSINCLLAADASLDTGLFVRAPREPAGSAIGGFFFRPVFLKKTYVE